MCFDIILDNVNIPDGLDAWLVQFLREAELETAVLIENGALSQAKARHAVLEKLVRSATAYLGELIDCGEAAELLDVNPETIRRKVRNGHIPDGRSNSRGHMKLVRGDVLKIAKLKSYSYDPTADAQDIAKLRRDVA